MPLVPAQRSPYGDPAQRTVVVVGSAGAVADAVRDEADAGWDTWAVVRRDARSWAVTVARRA